MSASPLTKSSSLRALLFRLVQHFGDTTNAPAIGFQGAKASATSSVAARQRGGSIWFEASEGKLVGTDPSGPIYFGLGRPVSTTISNGFVMGYGPGVGDPTAADYIPFTTELASFSYVLDEFKIRSPNKAIRISSVGNLVVEADGGSIVMALAAVAKFSATTTTTTIANSSTVQVQSTGGAAHLISNSANVCSMNGGNVTNRCATDFTIENFNASFQYEKWTFANNCRTSKWNVAGYAACTDSRYFYGTTTTTATLDMAGRFTPSIANGLVTITWTITGSTASGATGYMRYQRDTYRITAGVMTALSTSLLAAHTNLAAAPSIVASSTASGGTTLGLSVAAGDTTQTHWEAYADVLYTAAP